MTGFEAFHLEPPTAEDSKVVERAREGGASASFERLYTGFHSVPEWMSESSLGAKFMSQFTTESKVGLRNIYRNNGLYRTRRWRTKSLRSDMSLAFIYI
jgi:hypothetical protein